MKATSRATGLHISASTHVVYVCIYMSLPVGPMRGVQVSLECKLEAGGGNSLAVEVDNAMRQCLSKVCLRA